MQDKDVIKHILEWEESQTFECKRSLKKPSDVLPTICALANTDGGIFVYGLGDKKKYPGKQRLKGISEAKDNCDDLM
jgi:predicted HTH transcriptional regulator